MGPNRFASKWVVFAPLYSTSGNTFVRDLMSILELRHHDSRTRLT